MSKKEITVVAVLGLLIGLVWVLVGEIEVSGGTTIRYETITPLHKTWYDGMGTTINVHYVPPGVAAEEEPWTAWADLAQDHTFFWVKAEQWEGPNFLMVDLVYDRMALRDDQGRTYRLLNADVAAAGSNKVLESLLTAFDWTMFNQAFPGEESLVVGDLVYEGILLFEPLKADARTLRLHLYYNMSGQKARSIDIEFER